MFWLLFLTQQLFCGLVVESANHPDYWPVPPAETNDLVNATLLNVQQDSSFMWSIGTKPEKYQLKYFNHSDQIDVTYLNVPQEFDLTPFKGAGGVWVFAHTVRFGELYHTYFTKSGATEIKFFDKVQVRGYLHGNAQLLFFSKMDGINVSAVFSGNGHGAWEIFEIDNNKTNNFRLEIRTMNYGDFGFLDKVVGFYEGTPTPPPTVPTWGTTTTSKPEPTVIPSTQAPEPECPTTEPAISTTTPRDETCSSTCSCNCKCDCKIQ